MRGTASAVEAGWVLAAHPGNQKIRRISQTMNASQPAVATPMANR